MKKTKRIALCGVMSSLSLVIMLIAYFPYLTYTLPAIAGAFFAIIMVEAGDKWAWGSYITTSVLTLIMCEKEAAVLFIFFFGYYPILKSYLERISVKLFEYAVKIILFNIAVLVSYLVIIKVFSIPIENMGQFGEYTAYILLGMGNVVFFVYDMALSTAYHEYMKKYHVKLKNILK